MKKDLVQIIKDNPGCVARIDKYNVQLWAALRLEKAG